MANYPERGSNRRNPSKLMTAVWALCTATVFFANYANNPSVPVFESKLLTAITGFVYQIRRAYDHCGLIISLSAIVLFFLYRFAHQRNIYSRRIRFEWLLEALFASFHIAGIFFLNDYTFCSSPAQVFLMIVGWFGSAYFYRALIHLFFNFLHPEASDTPRRTLRIMSTFRTHPFAYTFLFLFVAWAIHMLLKYPAGMCIDAYYQLSQGQGFLPLNSHHPVFHTMLMTWFTDFGISVLHSGELGIFLFVLIEELIFAAIVAYGVSFLVRKSASTWTIVFALAFFGLSPFVTGYVGTVIKDLYYSIFVLFFTIIVIQYVSERERFFQTWYIPVLLIVSAVCVALFRNNGIYVTVPVTIILLIAEFRHGLKQSALKILSLLCAVVLPLVSVWGINAIYNPLPGSIAEALSIPLQQTARYVRDYGDDVTEEEAEIIARVLPYEELPTLYSPYISDPVKAYFNRDADSQALKDYFRVWFQQFLKHPGCYIASVWQQNVILLYPGVTNCSYYLSGNVSPLDFPHGDTFAVPEWLAPIQPLYSEIMYTLHELPILYLTGNMAVYIMAFLTLFVFMLDRRKYRLLICMIPALMSLLVIIAAPCIMSCVRYAYPIIYAMPFLCGVYTAEKTKGEELDG